MSFAAAQSAFLAGELATADTLLKSFSGSDSSSCILKAHIALLRGRTQDARRMSKDLVGKPSSAADHAAQALLILGSATCELGDFGVGLECLERARTTARSSSSYDTLARVQLHILEHNSDFGNPYHRTLPMCAETIRCVHKSGSLLILTEAHVAFARLEARFGNAHMSMRHLDHAERLLREHPNLWLTASSRLTRANLFWIQGDIDSAQRACGDALADARKSGWWKGEAIAIAGLAYFAVCAGEVSEAERLVQLANASQYSSPSLAYALHDTQILISLAEGDFTRCDRLWEEAEVDTKGVGSWYRLRGYHTRVRTLIRQRRFDEASELASVGAAAAESSRNDVFHFLFRLDLYECHAQLGADVRDLPLITFPNDPTLSLIGANAHTISRAFRSAGLDDFARQEAIAHRILGAAGATLEWGAQETAGGVTSVDPSATEDAVTLLDLAGYPHVLAREAFALLELSGAASALALIARSPDAARCVSNSGWTDAEALQAAGTSHALTIACGCHRDEIWEIVADLKPGLQDRCAAAAIRKLVDVAVTLDRYRREEKQRAALWPLDTFETDGGLWISEQMTELLSIARRIAPSDISVLLTGETGTGKEVMARAIHRASARAAKPFVPFNCTAVPRDMLESQLFGYRKGAFTGADDSFAGVIRGAAGGTLFLDEIAEIGPELQPKLLRFLETHEVHGLGEPQPIHVDVRIIAATNANLEDSVATGRFREDLFYRLNVVRLHLPPLRERREEIPPLLEHYLRTLSEQHKKGRLTLDDETLEFLVLFAWPGNVRQLVNEVSRIVAYADPDSVITPAALAPEIQASRRTVRLAAGEEPEIRVRLDQPLGDAVDAIERVMVARALDRARGNYENAARLLGISRKGLFLKRRRWGLQRAS